jgi:photosystem II stability/assembly factor-like uncharacterized protein
MNRALCIALSLAGTLPGAAHTQWKTQLSADSTWEYRGLYALSATVAWAGSRSGHFAHTIDGASWVTGTIPGAESLFLIAVRPITADTVYVTGTSFDGGLGKIFKTTDAGATWKEQFAKDTAGMFFDGMAFWDATHGIAFGDPIGGRIFMVTTDDGGETWSRVPAERLPAALDGEAAFAASGTAIATWGTNDAWIGTGGGSSARVYHTADRGLTWSVVSTPLAGGKTAGIFGLAFRDATHGIAVGGDYMKLRDPAKNVLATDDGGLTWRAISTSGPPGVRYGVAYVPSGGRALLIAVGPAGTGYSLEDGRSWLALDTMNVNTVAGAGGTAWVAGVNGRIAKWNGLLPVPLRQR